MNVRALAVPLLVIFAGCDTYHYLAGTIHEDGRRPVQALAHYETFLAHRPRDPRACEVRLRAAELYRGFGRCPEARAHYEAAARDFSNIRACLDRARQGLLMCPDYFPTDSGRTWVYVDSASGGRAARDEWEARPSSGSVGAIQSSLYAGDRRILTKTERFEKSDWAIWRLDKDGREPLLRYPYNEAMTWTAKHGKTSVEYLVVDSSAAVSTKAGLFTSCVKVREVDSRFKKSWKYDYYCPGVGKVRTSVGGPGFENPNMELSRFGKID